MIVAFEGKPITSLEELAFRMAAMGVGGSADIDYYSRGKKRSASVALKPIPASLRRQ